MNTNHRIIYFCLPIVTLSACNFNASQAPTWTPAPTSIQVTQLPPSLNATSTETADVEPTESAISWPTIDLSNVDRLVARMEIDTGAQDIFQLAFSPDGKQLTVGSSSAVVQIYNVTDGNLITSLSGHQAAVPAVAFSPDGTRLATGSYDKTIRLWNTADWTQADSWTAHESYVRVLAYSPDGDLLASGGEDNAVNLWPASGGERLSHLVGSGISVSALAFSPAGDLLVSAYGDSQARVWSVSDGTLLRSLVGFSTTHSLAFSDDGSLLAGGSWSYSPETLKPLGRIAFFEPGSGDRLYGTEFNTGALAMVFSGDGSILFSTTTDDEDFRLRAWRVADGAWLVDYPQPDGRPYALARNPQGNMLATGAQGGTILLWGVEP